MDMSSKFWKWLCWDVGKIPTTCAVVVCHNRHTVQSNYNFTLSHVITRVNAWLHTKNCCVPQHGSACLMSMLAMSNIVKHVNAWQLIIQGCNM